uniref:Carbohydrate sulfotransferase 9 n=1 Tax=Ailuropoda melanoleuca TaxID=9646 RepID=A0A7N5K9D7_AILME
MVMNPKQVFLSVLVFGVAGLLLFMYLQVWIEEQHTGRVEKKREQKATSGSKGDDSSVSNLRNEKSSTSCFKRRRDWSSMTEATEESNKISTEKCPLELEEKCVGHHREMIFQEFCK